MASHRSSRPVGFFLPGFPVLRFNDFSFTSSPLMIRQPRGNAGKEKSRGSAGRKFAAMSCNSPQVGERNILSDTRPSDNLSRNSHERRKRVRPFAPVAGACAPATLPRNEARRWTRERMFSAAEFACRKLEVAPAARHPHLLHLRSVDRETARYRKNPCVENENAMDGSLTQ
jgi:hypothetical protein